MNTKRKTIFLDRDGVINDLIDRGDNFIVSGKRIRFTAPFSFKEFKFKDRVQRALKRACELGYLRIVITNQPDLRYGLLPQREYNLIMEETKKLPIDDIFVCPHGRDDGCNCKKPKTGMFEEANKKWNIDFKSSYMIGDSETDIIAGKNLGLKTILINSSYNNGNIKADFSVIDLFQAIDLIEKL